MAEPFAEPPPPPPPPPASYNKGEVTAGRSLVPRGSQKINARSEKAFELRKQSRLDKELVWLQDPLKLAENTISLLRNNDDEKALETVRMASKRTPCTVSWNHIIDYEMSKGRCQKAVKIYNEMKKRAQQPDAQTYTILLRGLAWHPHLQESLPRALKIYHSMFADNCPIKPNIIHTNTVLKVCALAKDMDALWGVAAKLPTRGLGASNNLTFTIILNAIRTVTWQKDKDLPDEGWEEESLRRQRAVMQGRRMWEEIIPRWRAGDIWIDEELVCAMGRLLLLGSTQRDFDDVLSLAQQVMAIPRQRKQMPDPDEFSGVDRQAAISQKGTHFEESNRHNSIQDDAIALKSSEELRSSEENTTTIPLSDLNSSLTPLRSAQENKTIIPLSDLNSSLTPLRSAQENKTIIPLSDLNSSLTPLRSAQENKTIIPLSDLNSSPTPLRSAPENKTIIPLSDLDSSPTPLRSAPENKTIIPLSDLDSSLTPLRSSQENTTTNPLSDLNPPPTPALTNVFRSEFNGEPPSITTPHPGRNTLSLLLDACISLRAIPAAQRYWGILTSPTGPYSVVPDSENYHMYLRLLRIQRASRTAAELIADMHSGDLKDMRFLQPKTFRVALSCCVRDKNNIHSLQHASSIVEIMYKSLEYPDPRALGMYILVFTSLARTDYRPAIPALKTLESGMMLLKSMVNYGLEDVSREDKHEVVELARKVVGAYDFVGDVAGDRLAREESGWMVKCKKTWSAWVERSRRKWKERPRVGGEMTLGEEKMEREGGGGAGEREEGGEEEVGVEMEKRVSGQERKRRENIRRYGIDGRESGRKKRMQRARKEIRRSGEFDFYDG